MKFLSIVYYEGVGDLNICQAYGLFKYFQYIWFYVLYETNVIYFEIIQKFINDIATKTLKYCEYHVTCKIK